MSLVSSLSRMGLLKAVAGAGVVVYGVVAHAPLVLLLGAVLVVWGAVRGASRRRGQAPASSRDEAPGR